MKQMYITVMDYNTNEVSTYITSPTDDVEDWIIQNTDHQLDEIHWMANDCMPEIRVVPVN